MVSEENKANVVEIPLHSGPWLYFLLQHIYAQVALCFVFWGKKMSCSEVLSLAAEYALRDIGGSVGEGKRETM